MSLPERGVWLIEDIPAVKNTFIKACAVLALPFVWSSSYREYLDIVYSQIHEYRTPLVFIDNDLGDRSEVGYSIVWQLRKMNPSAVLVSSTFDSTPIQGVHKIYNKNKYYESVEQTRDFIKSLY
jgi:hypothetical protein